ncbi:hypothetical protein E1B28_004604 [Marasmius oreades]|uniref:AMP-activated protein kinase glycogen-binding domain-containing protein n=1 Tax=Marasmius oreades TaxID=181124 RepID=A0A9P7UZ34_9AGAR|nr:uncharacterized protein E1B28_004604 [Marasmius oreades]KAG7097233.1 hypothetical protein E1B28_004604 [Marasmius oreades]
MADWHAVTFEWPYDSANNVTVTGTFDRWSSSVRLEKQDSSFKATVKVPWNEKVAYKFIVDGEWLVNERAPTERDSAGNLNNIYVAPEKPAEPSHSDSTAQSVRVLEKVEETPKEQVLSTDDGKDVSAPQLLSDLAQTVVAAEGTESPVDYVASGIGAAIQGVFGVDPINTDKMPVQTPKAELVKASAVEASTTNHTDVKDQLVEYAKAAGVESDSPQVDVAANSVPGLNGTSTSTQDSGSAEPVQIPSILPVVSTVDSTLSPPPEEVVTAHGPSTHTPVGISNSSDTSAAAVSKAETPVVGSPDVLVAPEAETSSSPVSSSNVQGTRTAASISGRETNGNNVHPTDGSIVTPTSSTPASRATSPTPSTPVKDKHQRFPSTVSNESPKSDKSSSSSRFRTMSGTGSIRKSLAGLRRVSIKGIFGKHKEEN